MKLDNNTAPVYPWQQDQWIFIQSMLYPDRLPHALLITGAKGMGLMDFTIKFAASILCAHPSGSGENCQTCSPCHLLSANTHPDLLLVVPEEEGKAIKVEQIRKLVGFTQLQSHFNHRKVVIIHPAEAMNISSANSLLKTLEEPPGDTLIILLSHQASALPVTLRSRCQKIKISASSMHVRDWLNGKAEPEQIETVLASGCGPLFLADVDESPDRFSLLEDLDNMASGRQDPVDTAERWSKKQLNDSLFWLLKICQDLIKLKSVNKLAKTSLDSEYTGLSLVNMDMIESLTRLVEKYDIKGLFIIYDKLFEYLRLLSGNSSLKDLAILEDFTIEWVQLSKR